jgi:3-dehydroquinate synthase
MRRVKVSLGERSYPVLIDSDILSRPDSWAPWLDSGTILVVSNEVVAPLYLEGVMAALVNHQVETLVLPDGEPAKTPQTWLQILDRLAETGAQRDATVIALGGGVIGDMAGFAAASWMRGIRYLQAPTTLLAQVDASVGGKTGVNHPLGKNLVGAFHQPSAVLVDIATLKTLPAREYHAGLAEVVKTGAIRDHEFLEMLEKDAPLINQRDMAVLEAVVERCVVNKAQVVAADEKEAGERALLNFGHSFGHAIETLTAYTRYLHGEAVAIGMVIAAQLSELTGLCPSGTRQRLERILTTLQLPVTMPADVSEAAMLDCMQLDKKNLAGKLRLVVLTGIGQAEVADNCDESIICEAIVQCRNQQYFQEKNQT